MRPVGSVRQCVSKAGAEGVPAGSQEAVNRTGGGSKVACFRFAGRMSLPEWASDGECAAVAASGGRELSRVGHLASGKENMTC